MNRSPRTPLIEQMPLSVVPDKAVRIVQKTGHGLNMICLTIIGLNRPVMKFTDLIRTFQYTIPFFSGPFLHYTLSSFPDNLRFTAGAFHFHGYMKITVTKVSF